MEKMEMFEKERQRFMEDMKIPEGLSYKSKDDYKIISKAFDDAFKQYARRNKQTYVNTKEKDIAPVIETLHSYFNSPNITFDKCYENCIKQAKQILGNNKYGIAQKFVNMSFKHLMCFSNYEDMKEKFQACYLPLDKYTITWVRRFKNKKINTGLNAINNAWTNIDEPLYKEIQEFVANQLKQEQGLSYKVSYAPNALDGGMCELPRIRLCAEFIIWHQEKINETHKILERNKKDFERLGIRSL